MKKTVKKRSLPAFQTIIIALMLIGMMSQSYMIHELQNNQVELAKINADKVAPMLFKLAKTHNAMVNVIMELTMTVAKQGLEIEKLKEQNKQANP